MADDETDGGSEGQPKAFRKMTALVGGATALLVALGGLASAWGGIFGGHGNNVETKSEADAPTANVGQPADAETTNAVGTVPQPDPTSFTTADGGTFALDDGMWVWATNDGQEYRYKQVSKDSTETVAVLEGGGENGGDVYVRWPNKGGKSFQSYDKQESWRDGVRLTPNEATE